MVLAESLEALPGAEDGLASQRGRVPAAGQLNFEGPTNKIPSVMNGVQWSAG